jgi:hypothetical protein
MKLVTRQLHFGLHVGRGSVSEHSGTSNLIGEDDLWKGETSLKLAFEE